ncbi:MAG: CHAT domain-containing protein [Acidobacteriota bacterium]|nr:CHAT domain-containing protein [Acidobacteriota bacterium]
MPVFAELEFTVGPQSSPKAGYPVSPRLRLNGQEEIFPSDLLKIDLDELANLRAEDGEYEARLSELFFQAPNAKDALDKACAQLDQAGPGNALRVRLLIEPAAQELHHVRWECLRDTAGNPLFNGDTILFSRFLSSPNLRPIGPKTQLKALVAIANPPNLDRAIDPENPQTGLPPIDVKNEKLRAETGLIGAGFAVNTLASPPHGTVAATLDNILNELEKGCDVFYLVCHGGLVQQNGSPTPMLWLEDGEDPVNAARLVEGVRNMAQQPRLVVLASCQSAGADGTSAAVSGTLGALGPLLGGAGVPAVVAMQGNIKMSTVDRFMPQFLAELAKDGHIDRAMGKARGHVLDCNDYWMPVLFMRLSEGLIWSQAPATQANSG